MVPRLEFIHLIWSYLPGLPLALCMYLVIASATDVTTLLGPATTPALTLYFIIGPLTIGLYLDGFRHILPNWFPTKWKWLSIPKTELKKDTSGNVACGYSDQYIENLCAQTALTYVMYEFFGNMVISLILCAITFALFETPADIEYIAYRACGVLTVLSFIGMISFVRMNNKNIRGWFPE